MNSQSKCRAFKLCLMLLFVFCLLLLPDQTSSAQEVLASIGYSLDAGLNWGRQCLTGSIRYPLLPVLWMWICSHAGPFSRILQALPAFGCLHFLCRWYFLHRSEKHFSAADCAELLLASLFFFCCFHLKIQLGPETFLFVGFLFHLFRFQENNNQLGNLVQGAFYMGLLSLCGFLIIFIGGLLLLEIKMIRKSLTEPRQGIYLNLCLPFCYGLLLILILNWLIMGNCLFYFHEAYLWASGGPVSFSLSDDIVSDLLINLPGLFFPCLLLTRKKQDERLQGRILLFSCCLAILGELLRTAMGFQTDRLHLCLLLEFWSAMMLFQQNGKNRFSPYYVSAAALILMFSPILCHEYFHSFIAGSSENVKENLSIQQKELEQYIDHYWKDSRIIVLGDRLPAVFRDYSEKRYVSRLDYQKWEILKQAEEEQLHILLPPPGTGYYPDGRNSPLAKLYKKGAPWLLLEKQWPGGWQLLRVVPPPKGESRLEQYL